MTQVVGIPRSSKARSHLCYIVIIMGADVLATQGAKAPATVIMAMLNRKPRMLGVSTACGHTTHNRYQNIPCSKKYP